MTNFMIKPLNILTKVCNFFTPIIDLAIRSWIFKVFFMSGLTKIQSWDTTLQLFEYEYSVPLLSPTIAAYFGTAAELILPVLLILGIGARLPAIALFIFNIVAVVAYWNFLGSDQGSAGLMQHILWGFMIATTIAHGHGKLSVDYLLNKLKPEYKI